MVNNYLITGASGFFGINLVKYLLGKGCSVVGTDIADFEYPEFRDKIVFHKGDIRDKNFLEEISKDIDVIIHSAAALPLQSREAIFDINVNGTRNVLEAAVKNSIKRVVFISSTAVYGIPKVHPVPEDAELKGVGPYGESKIEAEKVCCSYRDKLCVPIIRPKTFAGPYRLGVFQILCDWVYSKKNIPIIGSGKNKYQLLHVDDLSDATYLLATADPKLANDTFNVGAEKFSSMKEDLQKLLDYAGYGKKVIPIPSWFIIPPLMLFDKLKLSPLYEWVYETADKDHYVSTEKIAKTFGWHPKFSTADTWIDTYKWYVQNKDNLKTGTTHRVAWKQGVIGIAKWFF